MTSIHFTLHFTVLFCNYCSSNRHNKSVLLQPEYMFHIFKTTAKLLTLLLIDILCHFITKYKIFEIFVYYFFCFDNNSYFCGNLVFYISSFALEIEIQLLLTLAKIFSSDMLRSLPIPTS